MWDFDKPVESSVFDFCFMLGHWWECVKISCLLSWALPYWSPGHVSFFSILGFWFWKRVIRFYILIRSPLFQWYLGLIFLDLVIHVNFWLCFYPLFFSLSINAAFLSVCLLCLKRKEKSCSSGCLSFCFLYSNKMLTHFQLKFATVKLSFKSEIKCFSFLS